jgi:hypothetical protein
MHLVMPWFLPLAGFVVWTGLLTVKDLPHESHRARIQVIQLLGISLIPLLVWLTVQITSRLGVHP